MANQGPAPMEDITSRLGALELKPRPDPVNIEWHDGPPDTQDYISLQLRKFFAHWNMQRCRAFDDDAGWYMNDKGWYWYWWKHSISEKTLQAHMSPTRIRLKGETSRKIWIQTVDPPKESDYSPEMWYEITKVHFSSVTGRHIPQAKAL